MAARFIAENDLHRCAFCKKEKPPDAFHKRKDRPIGRCSRCKDCTLSEEAKVVIRRRARARTREVREQVLIKYGNQCQCPGCHVTAYEFLAIDHIKGGGCKERREKNFPNSQAFYAYLNKNYEPDKYQILCHNCNSAKSFYGGCPLKGQLHYGG